MKRKLTQIAEYRGALLSLLLCGCVSSWEGPGKAPIASARVEPRVAVGASVTLDGSASFDPEGAELFFQWKLFAAPVGSAAKPFERTATTAGISPDVEGPYVVGLEVTDPSGLTGRDLAQFEASGMSSPGVPWFDPAPGSAWARRRRIQIDNSNLSEELVEFPVLVVLDAARIDHALAQAGGRDLRFVDQQHNGTLAHEIELWDPDGKSYVWVKLPRIAPAGAAAAFHMYYANPDAADGQAVADVWKNRYQAVFHLATGKDATGHGLDGTVHGSSALPAVLGLGQSFVKSQSQYIDLGKDRPIFQGVAGCTLSAWIRPKSFVEWDTIVGFSVHIAGTTYSRASLALRASGTVAIIGTAADDGSWKALDSPALTPNAWVHVTGVNVFQSNTQVLYLDGVQKAFTASASFPSPATPTTTPAGGAIGSQETLAGGYFDGQIDEIRLSHGVFSPAWVAADYHSMTDTLLTFGEEERKTP